MDLACALVTALSIMWHMDTMAMVDAVSLMQLLQLHTLGLLSCST